MRYTARDIEVCKAKKRYNTLEGAYLAIRGRFDLTGYLCPICGNYHLKSVIKRINKLNRRKNLSVSRIDTR